MPEETLPEQITPTAPQPTTPMQKSSPMKSIWVLLPIFFVIFGGILYYYMSYFMEQTEPTVQSSEPTLTAIKSAGKIIIGTDATYSPMEFKNDNGELVGYDIDLAEKIADELEIEAKIINIGWDDLFTALDNNEIDIIISSVTITDERKEIYDFSVPYLNAGQVIITQESNSSISSTADLSDKTIGVQEGTTNLAQALLYTDEQNVIAYSDFIEATQALVDGTVDAIFSDLPNAKSITQEYTTLKIASDPFTNEQYGIVVKKEKADLVAALDDAVNSLRQKGFLELLKQKWLE